MESICKFETKQAYEDYVNVVDMLGHVISEDKVYLKLGRYYSFCIHAEFTVPTNKDVQLLGAGSTYGADLTKFAKIKITNLDTEESRVINPTKVVNFEAGNYKVDYGIWIDDNRETYTTPNFTFKSCPEVTYIQVDPIVTQLTNMFVADCANLTGMMFGDPDQYPEGECVFNQPYSHNDVIINSHISFVDNSNGFLRRCPKIGNMYIADGVTNFVGCYGTHDSAMGNAYAGFPTNNFSDVKTEIYLGKDVQDVQFRAQNKIYRCIVSPENTYIEYDPITHTVIKKELNASGQKVILTGMGYGYPNHTLTIPAGYTMGHGYSTFAELPDIETINLLDYDATGRLAPYPYPSGDPRSGNWYYISGVSFDGFRDMDNVETLILPRNTVLMPSKYCNGFGKVKNLVIPAEQAPVVAWSGQWGYWGDRSNVMPSNTTPLTGGTNNQDCGMGWNAEERNIYVIYNGETSEEALAKKASWTNDYDNVRANEWARNTGEVDDQGRAIYVWERPNIWKYIQMNYENAPEAYRNYWGSACKSPCREYTLSYLTESEMEQKISELLSNN